MKDIIVGVDTLKARILDSIFQRMDEGEFKDCEDTLFCVLDENERLLEILKEFECDEE